MTTTKQKKLAHEIVKNASKEKPDTAGSLLEKVGYAEGLVKQPGRVIEAPGVQEELARLGFDPVAAKSVVAEILYAGDNDASRLKAADMIFKVHGTYAAEKHISLNVEVETSEKIKDAATKLNELFGGRSLTGDGIGADPVDS